MGPIERLYLQERGLAERPTCKVCSSELRFKTRKKGYGTYCSVRCSRLDPESDRRRRQTNLERYGSENPFGSRDIMSKIRETNTIRYGSAAAMANSGILDKTRATFNARYGVGHALQIPSSRSKFERTSLDRYGVRHPAMAESVKDKIVSTSLKNRGTPHPRQLKEDLERLTDVDWLADVHLVQKLNTVQISGLLGRATPKTVAAYIDASGIGRVKWKKSSFQSDVASFVSSMVEVSSTDDRTIIRPFELDIVIADRSVAIECDGAYWHSLNDDPLYHDRKTVMAADSGLQLLHIFDLEWYDSTKGPIWRSIVRSKLGQIDERMGARKCSVTDVSSSDYRKFLERNHLQGAVNSSIRMALRDREEIVAVMGFSKSRFGKTDDYEMVRYCSRANTTIAGGAGRLLAEFERTVEDGARLVSYSNRRHSSGEMYQSLGFTHSGKTRPNYAYIVNGELVNRMNFQKSRLASKISGYDEALTEHENMSAAGHRRVWDCGSDIWRKVVR